MAPDKAEQPSPDICNSQIILFLGAGASASLGLKLMGSFMDLLEKRIPSGLRPVLPHMCAGPDGSKDLEILFERIEGYHEFESYSTTDQNWSNVVHRGKVDQLMRHVRDIRNRTEDLVVRHYSGVEAADVVPLYADFLALLAQSNGDPFLPIFTTNYDTAIEDFVDNASDAYELVDGFTGGSRRYWSPNTTFHGYRVDSTDKNTLLLFKLHGSSTWRVNTQTEVVTKESTAELVTGESEYENALVWPGLTKVIKKGPYETNYAYLEECLRHARLCVVIGFSFRDEPIREYFTRALSVNQQLQIVVIDPRAKAVIKDRLETQDFTRINPIAARFCVDELAPITMELAKLQFPWKPGHLIGLTAQPD